MYNLYIYIFNNIYPREKEYMNIYDHDKNIKMNYTSIFIIVRSSNVIL